MTAPSVDPHHIEPLVALLRGARVLVLTGAGCSTESGIPDYRGPETLRRARNPIRWADYMANESSRRRYWARSMIGWPRMRAAAPNAAHHAIAALEHEGVVSGLITQNVDRLHHAAGSRRIIELHGAIADVRCLDCHHLEARAELQERLEALNHAWDGGDAETAPDGDAEIPIERLAGFRIAACRACDEGTLKPDVVFFGENVPRTKVDAAFAMLDDADVLLVVGSSLAVFSGFRFVRGAVERERPVAIVNLGPTRGDEHARVRVEGSAGAVMSSLRDALGGRY